MFESFYSIIKIQQLICVPMYLVVLIHLVSYEEHFDIYGLSFVLFVCT